MKLILRLLIVFTFVVLGISFWNQLLDFELKLYEIHLTPYVFSGIFARILLSLYFVLALFFLFAKPTKVLISVGVLVLILPLYVFLFNLFSEEIIHLSIVNFLPLWLTILLVVISLLIIIVYKKNITLPWSSIKPIRIVNYIFSIAAVVLVFVLNPLFLDEFQDISEKKEQNFEFKFKPEPTLNAFFSTSCPYCEMASKRLKVLEKNYDGFPEVQLFFIGTEEGVSWFFEDTHTQFNYTILEQKLFLDITEGSFPKFVYTQKGKPANYFSGRTFNYLSPSIISL